MITRRTRAPVCRTRLVHVVRLVQEPGVSTPDPPDCSWVTDPLSCSRAGLAPTRPAPARAEGHQRGALCEGGLVCFSGHYRRQSRSSPCHSAIASFRTLDAPQIRNWGLEFGATLFDFLKLSQLSSKQYLNRNTHHGLLRSKSFKLNQ